MYCNHSCILPSSRLASDKTVIAINCTSAGVNSLQVYGLSLFEFTSCSDCPHWGPTGSLLAAGRPRGSSPSEQGCSIPGRWCPVSNLIKPPLAFPGHNVQIWLDWLSCWLLRCFSAVSTRPLRRPLAACWCDERRVVSSGWATLHDPWTRANPAPWDRRDREQDVALGKFGLLI